MKELNQETIERLASESMFSLSPEEVEEIKEGSKAFLEQIELLNAVDVSDTLAMDYPFEEETTWLRNDQDTHALSQEEVLLNAPLVEGDFVEIVKVLK